MISEHISADAKTVSKLTRWASWRYRSALSARGFEMQDVEQEAWIVWIKCRRKYSPNRPRSPTFWTYFCAALIHRIYELLRHAEFILQEADEDLIFFPWFERLAWSLFSSRLPETSLAVLEALKGGYTYAEVAQRLGISRMTVHRHIHRIRQEAERFGLRGDTQP